MARTFRQGARRSEQRKERLRPLRARLCFDELWSAETKPRQPGVRHRIKIDPENGVVKAGAYQVIESPYAPGERVTFSGCIDARIEDEAQRYKLKHWLEKGLSYVPALGALRGRGAAVQAEALAGEGSQLCARPRCPERRRLRPVAE